MIQSSFLNPKNKNSMYAASTLRMVLSNCILFPLFVVSVPISVPLFLYVLEIITNGESRTAFPLCNILWILLSIPYVLLFGNAARIIFLITYRLKLDINDGITNNRIITGIIKEKTGMKTMGPIVDEYTIKLDDGMEFYVDKVLYSKAKPGNNVKLKFLPRSKVVIEYEIIE